MTHAHVLVLAATRRQFLCKKKEKETKEAQGEAGQLQHAMAEHPPEEACEEGACWTAF